MAGTLNTPAPTDPIKANGFYSFVVTINNDDVFSFTPKGTCGHIFLATTAASHHGLFWWRGSAQSKYSGAATTVGITATGPVTALLGSPGNTTLIVYQGTLYIENRSGGTLEYIVTLLTENSDYE